MNKRRRGILLVLVMATLMLVAAIIAPLARFSGVEAVIVSRQAADLRHRIAAESMVGLLPQLLRQVPAVGRDLDRDNTFRLTLSLADDVEIELLLQDDSAKLPLALVAGFDTKSAPRNSLDILAVSAVLPALARQSMVKSATGCFEDWFEAPTDAAIYGTPTGDRAWCQFATLIRQTVNYLRAPDAVLEALFADQDPVMARRLIQARRGNVDKSLGNTLGGLGLTASQLDLARKRLTDRTERYSLTIRTRIGADVRQRYLLCSADDLPYVLANWEVTP